VTFVTVTYSITPTHKHRAQAHNRCMVRRVPQREREINRSDPPAGGTIAWMLRFLDANKKLLPGRKRPAHLAHKPIAHKTA